MRPDPRSSMSAGAIVMPGGSKASPFQEPGLLARVAPFAVCAVLAEASLALPPGPQSTWAVVASAVLLLAVAVAFPLPWSRLPAWLPVVIPLAYTGSVLALILAAGPTSGVGVVILVPLVWTALFHRRWESACVVAAVVAVEVTISLTPAVVADAVIVRRVLLWALLGTLISVATHSLRDGITRSQAERERLQGQLRELTVLEDRERIAAVLGGEVVQQIFASGLSLQGTADLIADVQVRRRIDAIVGDLDRVVRTVRGAVFDLGDPPRHDGLRQQVVAVCSGLVPVPEINFTGQGHGAISLQAQAQIVDLLRGTLELIGRECVPGRIEISAGDESCLVVIDAASRDHPADEAASEPDFSGLLKKVSRFGGRADIETIPGGLRFGWRLPPDRPARRPARDADRPAAWGADRPA